MPSDFVVDWQGTEELTSEKIIEKITCQRLDAGMPVIIGFVGRSRSGKTRWALKIQEIIYRYYGLNFVDYLPKVVMIKADDWTSKVRPILEEQSAETKKIKTLHMDEAKFTVSTDDWQKIKNKALRAVIGVGAVVQPLVIIIIAQIRKDIDSRVRETLDYLFEVKRSPQSKPRITCVIPYEKVYDMSNIKILTRNLQGIIKYPDGTHQQVFPVFTPTLPSPEVEKAYDAFEKPDKVSQLLSIMDEVDADTKKQVGSEKSVLKLVELLVNNPNELEAAGKWVKDKWKLSANAKYKYNRTPKELGEVERLINEKLGIKTTEVVDDGVE